MARPAATLVVLLVVLVVLAGCSTSGRVFGGREGTPSTFQSPPTSGAAPSSEAEAVAIYLRTLGELVNDDPIVQADGFRRAVEAADTAPTTTNRLNLALALAIPGHPSSNPAEAQRQLNALLASDALLPEERTLALVHLEDVEQRLILDAEARRLQRAVQAANAQRNDQSAQRLQAALEENRQLKAELEEAKAKLDAITNIERSIRERENGTTPPR
jgi:hypothetical protein